MFTGVPVNGISQVWSKVEPMIRDALALGETTSEVLLRLYKGDAQLWVILNDGEAIAAVVTEVVTEVTDRKVCNIWAVGGSDMHKWFDFLSTIEEWAADNGCDAIGIEHARPGWKRLMKDYKITHVSLEKEL